MTAERERGFALLIVLWILALLALVLTQALTTSRVQAQVAENVREAAILEEQAEGLVHEAMFRLADPSARRWRTDAFVHPITFAGGTARIRLRDEAGLLNPNRTSAGILATLLRVVGVAPDPAKSLGEAIAAWRDPRGMTAAGTYLAAGRDYAPAGRPFRSVDELGLVLGMQPVWLRAIAPHLSIWTEGTLDPAQSDPVVRAVLKEAVGNFGEDGFVPEPADARIVAISVIATSSAGAAVRRDAVVRLATGASDGVRFQVLDWNPALRPE